MMDNTVSNRMTKITYHDGLRRFYDLFKINPSSITVGENNKVKLGCKTPDLSYEIKFKRSTVFDYNILAERYMDQDSFNKLLNQDEIDEEKLFESEEINLWFSLPNNQVIMGYKLAIVDGNLTWKYYKKEYKSQSDVHSLCISDLLLEFQEDGRVQFYSLDYTRLYDDFYNKYEKMADVRYITTGGVIDFINSTNMFDKTKLNNIVSDLIKTHAFLLKERYDLERDGMDEEEYTILSDRLLQILRAEITINLDNQ